MRTLPSLFKLTSTGAIQTWSIGVEANVIIVLHGQQDGKIQRTEETIKDGKNIGRSNETTPEEQAWAEATSKWEGKIKKGYVEDISRAAKGEKDMEGGFDCMLAHKFADSGHKIKYPAYIQPKLNGHRCLAVVKDGVCTLWSRTRKPITSMPHIVKELQDVYPTGHHELDGELYNHSYKDRFEDLSSFIRQEVPKNGCEAVEYHLYDKRMDGGFGARIGQLQEEFRIHTSYVGPLTYIKLTSTFEAVDEDKMMAFFEYFLSEGYEGGMARNEKGLYAGKRSYDLQKIKDFQDDEFKIVDCVEGRGGYAGCGIFVCQAKNNETFNVKMRGPKEQLMEFLAKPSTWKGKMLTVKYQYISAYGIPIFPVGERFA